MMGAQYHLQKIKLTRSFFVFLDSLPMASDPRKKTTKEVFYFFSKKRKLRAAVFCKGVARLACVVVQLKGHD
jgi:hypothetical protein